MVERQIAGRGIRDARVLDAMRRVPREAFIAADLAFRAHDDGPLPIGRGQTISQPYIVALMAQAAAIGSADRVLEVGAGCGYAAAVLATLAAEVLAIERLDGLADLARTNLERIGVTNVKVVVGDGTLGYPAAAPYEAIVVSAGGPTVPRPLKEQLAPGGRLVMPLGSVQRDQRLVKIVRTGEASFEQHDLGYVSFVSLIGVHGWPDSSGQS